MRIKLWGTRGSIPSPLRSEEIEAKIEHVLLAAGEAGIDLNNPTAVRAFISSFPQAMRGTAGGDTSCLEVRSAGNIIIFDCGSGMRRLGLELMKEEFGQGKGVAHIFICHTHWDHMMGWPFFSPIYVPGNRFIVYGVHSDMEQRFRHQQTTPSMFPIDLDYHASDIQFKTLREGETIEIGETRLKNMCFPHPGDSYGYRVEDRDGVFIYAGDAEYKTLDPEAVKSYVEFFQNADALVFDAMFSLKEYYFFYEDWGHSSAVAGADLATRAGVKHLLLFHHAPASTDEQIWGLRDEAEEYLNQHPERPLCEIIVASDGFEMEIWREAKLAASTERLKQGTVVHLSGRLVEETSPDAWAAIETAAKQAGSHPLVVNLREVDHVGEHGLKTLLAARRHWRPLGLAGLTPEVRRTLVRCGALESFAVSDKPMETLEALIQGLDVKIGQILCDRYKISDRRERGPLGDFYRATDQALNREVTVLVMCPSLGRTPSDALIESARSAAKLRHTAIAEIIDAQQDGHIKFLALEYTPGLSLRELLKASSGSRSVMRSPFGNIANNDGAAPLEPLEALTIVAQVTQALENGHRQNLVHGGLKPENIILMDDGSIKVTEFGISRLEIHKPLSELPAYMGSLAYLAPEQIQGQGNSVASDLYALGAILYEMVTGQPPYTYTDRDEELIALQLRQPPIPPRRRNLNLSRSLEHLVLKLLNKLPDQRVADAAAMRQALNGLAAQLDQKPLLGREAAQQKLRQHLKRAASGQSGMLVIQGSRGVGKSRLALSVATQSLGEQSLTTLHSELYAFEDSRPYRVFTHVLQRHLLSLPAHRLSQLLDDLGALAHPLTMLIPQLRSTSLAAHPAEGDCQNLQDAICQTVELLAKSDPVMFILDSLQWADVASLRLLKQLARQRIPRLLIVALYRSEAVNEDHPLQHTLRALDAWIDERLNLTPLGPIEVHQMTSSLGTTIPPDFGLWLYSETEGNPLHTTQLIQAFSEGPGETRQPRERSSSMTMDEVVLRRLERLPNIVLTTLRQAAVLGHEFGFDNLRVALDQPEAQVLNNLDVALRAGMILGHPVDDQYRFSHPTIREVIYTEMLGGVRKRYHARAARILEQESVSGRVDEKIDLLAHHCLQAGEHAKAVTYLARATRRSRLLCADDAALVYVNRALDLVDELVRASTNERERAQRLKQRSDLLSARARLEADLEKP